MLHLSLAQNSLCWCQIHAQFTIPIFPSNITATNCLGSWVIGISKKVENNQSLVCYFQNSEIFSYPSLFTCYSYVNSATMSSSIFYCCRLEIVDAGMKFNHYAQHRSCPITGRPPPTRYQKDHC